MSHSAQFYIDQLGMSRRPEFYSGRGPNWGDLNEQKLEKFFTLVTKHGGKDAAEAFVSMVAGIKSGAATTFLLGLYQLERNDWKWENAEPSTDREWDVSSTDDEGRMAVGFATVFETAARGGRDETGQDHAVRAAFLERHGYDFEGPEQGWVKLEPGKDRKRRLRRDGTYSTGGYGDWP